MSVNDKLLDAAIDHQIDLQRYGNGVVKRMLANLDKVDADLFAQLTTKLETMSPERFTVQRLDKLLESVRKLNGKAYEQMTDGLALELHELADYEADYQHELFKATLPTQLSVASVSAEQVYAAAISRPFQGKLLKEFMQGLETGRAVRIRDAIRIGYIENQTIGQMVQRLRGTRSLKYNDGLIQIDRRHAEAVVRTAISHTASFARDRFYAQNETVIKAERWVSVLDSRTSPTCMELSGKLFPVGKGRKPPAHMNCRSVRVAVLKSWRELGFDMDDLPASTQSSMDGQVPGDWTYNDWLKRQSAGRQDEILGRTRGKLYRSNELPVDRYINRNGDFITLDDMRKRDSAAFHRAGL